METIVLPINGEKINFLFDKDEARDKEMDEILQGVVENIGELKGTEIDTTSPEEPIEIHMNNDQAELMSEFSQDFELDESLNRNQTQFLSRISITMFGLESSSPSHKLDLNGFGAQVVQKLDHEGFSYLLLMPLEDEKMGEVIYYTEISNSMGVDWLDFVLELLVGIIALMFALGVGSTLGKIVKGLRKSRMYDRLKTLLRSPTFQALLKKLAELIPGGKKTVDIFEALKEIIKLLWEHVIRPGMGDIKKALGKALGYWSLIMAGLSWLLRFLSGGAAIVAELTLLLAALGIKVLAKDDTTV